MMRSCFLFLIYASVHAYVVLLPPNFLPNSGALPPQDAPRFSTYDLFERVAVPEPPPAYMQVSMDAVLQPDCVMTYKVPTQPTLLLIGYDSYSTARCISFPHILAAADASGVPTTVTIGFYNKDEDMYDVAGPMDVPPYSSSELPTLVQGIAVDPAFAAAVKQRLAAGNATVTYVYLEREPGKWNDMVTSFGFRLLFIMTKILCAIVFCYGVYHFVYPLIALWRLERSTRQTHTLPEGWISPRERRYWRPNLHTWIRLCSLYCLLSWMVSWRYKRTPYTNLVYFFAIFAITLGFALTVTKWCFIANSINPHWSYKTLRYLVVVQVVVAFVAIVFEGLQPYDPYNVSLRSFQKILENFIWGSIAAVCHFTFCVHAILFLRRIKTIGISKRAYKALRKLTLVALGDLVGGMCFLLSGTIQLQVKGNNYVRYLVMMLLELVAWIFYHTFMFYWLSIDIPSREELEVRDLTRGLQLQSSLELTANSSEPIRVEKTDPQAKWNDLVLQPLRPAPPRVQPQTDTLSLHFHNATQAFGLQINTSEEH